MIAGIGHWARSRLAEHRAMAEYRHAWRRLRRLHADTTGQGRDLSNGMPVKPSAHPQKEEQ